MANPLYGQNKADSEVASSSDVSSYLSSYAATGTVDSKVVRCIEIAGAGAGVIALTGARGEDWAGQFVTVYDNSSAGTDAHTFVLSSGTWDGTNNKITLNAPKEFICCYFNSDGVGSIIENVGSVALASV